MIVAHSIRVGLCTDEKCRAVHINFFDEEGRHVAAGTVGVENIPRVIEKLRDLAYEIATTRGGVE